MYLVVLRHIRGRTAKTGAGRETRGGSWETSDGSWETKDGSWETKGWELGGSGMGENSLWRKLTLYSGR